VSKKRSPELIALQENFRLEVVFGGDPDAPVLPCWYGEHVDDAENCEGRIIASHFVKRGRIDNALFAHGLPLEERQKGMWDPRFAVPGCTAHDDRWDGHRMPPLVIYRHQVPAHVEAAAVDWSLGEQLTHRCPSISSECATGIAHRDVQSNQGGSE
jgi:hypothetical protein